MRVLEKFLTPPHPCAYISERVAKLDYSFSPDITPAEYERLMNEGYRKFGALFFKPVCDACDACRPIRVPVATFKPDRSQRRAWQRNTDLEVKIAPPTVDDARLELYSKYHEAQATRRGWPGQEKDEDDYVFSFVRNPIPAIEISVWEGAALRAIMIAEITPNVISDVYHFHDLSVAHRGLGTFCTLNTIELGRTLGKRWVYLGYYVEGCASMEYKARFRPCEILGTDGMWRPKS